MVLRKTELDDFLLLRFKNGDELAFEKIFNSTYKHIVGFCYQFIRDEDKAQNLAQEAFLNLWLNREKIRNANGIKAFLYTFAKSGCLNDIRHRKIVKKYEDRHLQAKENELDSEILESFDFNALEFSELETLIRQAIAELPEKCRQVFILSRLENKMNKEIAAELGISVKAVEANMSRALKTLRLKLADYIPSVVLQAIIYHLS